MSPKEIFIMRLWRFLREKVYRPSQKVPRSVILDIRPFSNEYREFFLRHFSYLKEDTIKKADRILGNKVEFFGRQWPLTGFDYKLSHSADPKYIWELNRHQFLPVLAKAFFITDDERYAEKIVSLTESWIEQNPPFSGINWRKPLEPALRQISWLWSLKYIARSRYLNEKIAAKIRQSLFNQTAHISRNLSLYSSANNHLIGELASMVMVGTHLGVEKWVKNALKILNEQINNQILDDGIGAEQSISYQLYTMEYYLIAMLYLSENNIPAEGNMFKKIEKAAEFISTIIDKNGFYPDIGDNDSGFALKLSESYHNSKTLLNLAAYITGNTGLLQKDAEDDEKLFWLLGPGNFKTLIEKGKANINNMPQTFIYSKGGYGIFKKNDNKPDIKMIFDFGPLGLQPLAGHAHADALSFLLYVNGQPVFIDPGTYSYNKGFWRNYFRGTCAHNTICIDGQDQSIFSGPFLASYHAKTECVSFENNKSICARHYGYNRLKIPVVHTRTVRFSKENTITIADKIETGGGHLIEQFFHLDKNCKAEECGENIFKIISPKARAILKLDRQVKTAVYYGDEALPLGWQSTCYGSKEKTFSIVGRIKIRENKELITEINV